MNAFLNKVAVRRVINITINGKITTSHQIPKHQRLGRITKAFNIIVNNSSPAIRGATRGRHNDLAKKWPMITWGVSTHRKGIVNEERPRNAFDRVRAHDVVNPQPLTTLGGNISVKVRSARSVIHASKRAPRPKVNTRDTVNKVFEVRGRRALNYTKISMITFVVQIPLAIGITKKYDASVSTVQLDKFFKTLPPLDRRRYAASIRGMGSNKIHIYVFHDAPTNDMAR